ncbi:MAG: PorT family protein [Candidatus Marinimicrobia bacterium]|nr:PorT family protein [Candidatus Neomarinimicrobiota bacterium]
MKKIMILMIILSLVLIGTVSAQGMGFGVKGGLNISRATGDGVKILTDFGMDQKYLMGFSAGGFVTLPLGNTITIRPEVLYTQNGSKYEGSFFGTEAKIVTKMNWLNSPVLAVFNVGPVGVFAGPYFDIFLNGKYKWEASGEGASFDEEEDIEKDEVKTLNYGVIFGAALGVTNNIDIELRYSQGLNSFDKEPDDWDEQLDGKFEESDIKPSMIQALVNFYLKK